MKALASALVAISLCIINAGSALSARMSHTFETREETGRSRLIVNLSGPIEKGDAAKIEAILNERQFSPDSEYHFGLVTLDSPGGSYAGAIELIELFYRIGLGTYIRPGARCFSACALAFMAGTARTNYRLSAYRTLHPTARLGFHAPSLNIEGTAAVPRRRLRDAYQLALKSIAAFVAKKRQLDIPDSLLSVILETPPEEMYILKTIDDVNRWKIHLDVERKFFRENRMGIASACLNYRQWKAGKAHNIPYYAEVVPPAQMRQWIATAASNIKQHRVKTPYEKFLVSVLTVNEEADERCYHIKQTNSDIRQERVAGGAFFELHYSASNVQDVLQVIKSRNVNFLIGYGAHTLPPETKLKALNGKPSLLNFKL